MSLRGVWKGGESITCFGLSHEIYTWLVEFRITPVVEGTIYTI